jgi:tRNA-Thr(GGU) m(6)t(6)A37 methyltransferase TsaA
MMIDVNRFDVKPIGFVKRSDSNDNVKDRDLTSQIVLPWDLVEALDGIEEFSHVFIIFWMHRISDDEKKVLQARPRGRSFISLRGVFATRTPNRPNPIGLTLVQLLKVENNILTVRGLDAFDGTPVLDIKPFDHWDMAEDFMVPEWLIKLEKERRS